MDSDLKVNIVDFHISALNTRTPVAINGYVIA